MWLNVVAVVVKSNMAYRGQRVCWVLNHSYLNELLNTYWKNCEVATSSHSIARPWVPRESYGSCKVTARPSCNIEHIVRSSHRCHKNNFRWRYHVPNIGDCAVTLRLPYDFLGAQDRFYHRSLLVHCKATIRALYGDLPIVLASWLWRGRFWI